jgi:hypothetical protein
MGSGAGSALTAGVSELAAELGLDIVLPALVAGQEAWVEFGLVERAYAHARPGDFAALVERYSHTAIVATRYSASAFLARTLVALARRGEVLFHDGPATGRWAHTQSISWWATEPAPDWAARVSWESVGAQPDSAGR